MRSRSAGRGTARASRRRSAGPRSGGASGRRSAGPRRSAGRRSAGRRRSALRRLLVRGRAGARRRSTPRRPGARRRRAIALAGGAALVSGMLVSIRRGADGRLLSEALEELAREQRTERARLAAAVVRLDSLTSRERMLDAAAALGLRPATDGEIVFVAEPGEPGPAGGDGT